MRAMLKGHKANRRMLMDLNGDDVIVAADEAELPQQVRASVRGAWRSHWLQLQLKSVGSSHVGCRVFNGLVGGFLVESRLAHFMDPPNHFTLTSTDSARWNCRGCAAHVRRANETTERHRGGWWRPSRRLTRWRRFAARLQTQLTRRVTARISRANPPHRGGGGGGRRHLRPSQRSGNPNHPNPPWRYSYDAPREIWTLHVLFVKPHGVHA
jgi:hypothetical protein